jgi:hypothetical protein
LKTAPGSSGSISMLVNTEGYAFGHIQETAKSGGLQFMLDRLINYYEVSRVSNPNNDSFIMTILTSLRQIVNDFSKASPIAFLGIEDTEIPELDLNYELILKILGLDDNSLVMNGYIHSLDEINSLQKVLNTLTNSDNSRDQSVL